ncbi:MAG: chorismate-binding protein [Bacteroidia bacterium]|nr:chorismate-binding protein [Bacteroidia bacterium]
MHEDSTFLSGSILQEDQAFVLYHLPGADMLQVSLLAPDATAVPPADAASFAVGRFDCFTQSEPCFFRIRISYSVSPGEFRPEQSLAGLGIGRYEGRDYEKALFCANVNRAVQAMERGEFQKVVLSRPKWKAGVSAKQTGTLLRELCAAYPLSFVCLFHHPQLGCWITATPELLLNRSGDILQTVSLAGTRVSAEGAGAWGSKELAEQQWVTDYIQHVLEDNGVRDLERQGPETLRTGHIEHLRTRFSGRISNKNTFGEVLKALHPTPAVGGVPKERAAAFISGQEGYDRQLYSGFCGPVDADGSASLFVQLRTARIYTNGTLYFVGAGITAASHAEAEWEETENKYRILAQFLQSE